jgi:transcriptional regulator with PAS, ATPase and Fis domain
MSRCFNADTEYRRSCQKYLGDLIARRDFPAACRYFDSIQDVYDGVSDLESGIILRLGARAFGSSDNLPRALKLIRNAINIISDIGTETDELAECFIVLGNILRDIGKFGEAEKAYRDAESIFRRNDNLSKAGVALNRLSAVYFRRGQLDSSLKCLIEAVEYAKKEGDNRKLAYLFGNIGRVYTLLGKLKSAEENIKLNIELSDQLRDRTELGRACLSLGYVYVQLGDLSRAEEALSRAFTEIQRNNMEKEEIIYLTYLGELRYRQGRFSEADRLLNEAADRGKKIAPESLLAARPLRQLAESLVRQKNFRKAMRIVNKAGILMKNLNDLVEIGALHRLKAICLYKLGRENDSRKAFLDSIAVLEDCRAKVELADTLAEAGKSTILGSRQKTMYLCRAEEIYSCCGISPRVVEIQKTIGNLDVDSEHLDDSDSEVRRESSDFPTRNAKMRQIISSLRLLKDSDIPILITGETGSGKDHLARYFHSISRPQGPYVAVNCAAVPDTLMESELFGYRKGAFTGAETDRHGLFLAGNNGVLLLDEVGDLPWALQVKLLNVIETKKLRPLGTSREIELDLIILAATNRDLYQMVEEGDFRRDLYYRLAGITLELPPLRERKEDIPYLLGYFMRKYDLLKGNGTLDGELVRQFVSYDWPGNIRQLENKVKQLSVMAAMAKDGSVAELAQSFFQDRRDESGQSLFEQVEQFEKRLLTEALISAGGNKSEASRILSIHESTFRAKMKRYGLEAVV